MKPRSIAVIMVLCIFSASTSTASVLSPLSSPPSFNMEKSSDLNKTILRYPYVKVIMPVTSNLYQINMGFLKGFGFGNSKIALSLGYVVFVKFMVVGGNITVKPFNQASVILHPGDNITVLFGTFHAFFWSSDGGYHYNGQLIGRFLGVKIEKFQ